MRKIALILGMAVIGVLILYIYGHVYAEQSNVIQVNLEDSLTMTDKMGGTLTQYRVGEDCWKKYLYDQPCLYNAESKKPSLVGNIVSSQDGTTCWKVEELTGVYYYKLIGDCPNA